MSKPTLDELLSFFPVVEAPITFSEDLVTTFDNVNKVLPKEIIEEFIIPWEAETEIDEYTEFIPCVQLANTDEFHALVYWKGSLMKYEYVLVTLMKNGDLITRKPISSIVVDGDVVKRSIARIDEEFIIHIMAGANAGDELDYNPEHSRAFNMEIMPTGDIIFSLGDD